MTPFLQQIARQALSRDGDLSRLLFVFPSRRAVIFFQKYLSEEIAVSTGTPVCLPQALTIDEFFLSLTSLRKADDITLLIQLYTCYSKECKTRGIQAESLDDFVFWGNMILSDFNDMDKYLVNSADLLRNIAEYRAMKDDFSFLSPTQKEAMRRFMGHFGDMGVVNAQKKYKQLFASVWDILLPLYESFNKQLALDGASYEGAVYRSVAADARRRGAVSLMEEAFPDCSKVVFCALNALNECEKTVMDSLKKAGMAAFCWDYASPLIKDRENRSSFFMEKNLERFGNDLELEACDRIPEIEVIAVPSSVGQTKMLDRILKKNPSMGMNEKTAVMLSDETLLLPQLSSIPEQVKAVNVTMGYPMTSSSFYALMSDISRMLSLLRVRDGKNYVRHDLAWSIASNNIFYALATEQTRLKVSEMKKARRRYVACEDLCGTPLLDVIFTDMPVGGTVGQIADYLRGVAEFLGTGISADGILKESLALEMDFAMEYCKAVNLLSSKDMDVSVDTWTRLLENILSTKSIPFAGEPLCGLQIMGPLEMRALDFDHLIIVGANEKVFPRRAVASSFIPPLMRKAFDLPTYEYQDAVWAYYFYRMIQRPQKVWMIYDSRSEGLKSGEESRYIKQLRYHFRLPVKLTIAASAPGKTSECTEVAKTTEMISRLLRHKYSASALKTYLTCQMRFYYSYVEGLRPEDEVEDTLDAAMSGTVIHNTLEELFSSIPDGVVTVEVLDAIMKDTAGMDAIIRRHIMEQLRADSISGREIVLARVFRRQVHSILKFDRDSLENGPYDSFKVLAETPMNATIGRFTLTGIIDRMDIYPDGRLKIVDYKTGFVGKEDFRTDEDAFAETLADKIFSTDTPSDRIPGIALQIFLYGYIVNHPLKAGAVPDFTQLVTSIYSTRMMPSAPPKETFLSSSFSALMEEKTLALLEEIVNPQIPFTASGDDKACECCDFSNICQKCSR